MNVIIYLMLLLIYMITKDIYNYIKINFCILTCFYDKLKIIP